MLNYLILLVKNKKPSLRIQGYESIPVLVKTIFKRSGHLMRDYGWVVILDLGFF
jgi:hypothetical protein